MQTLEPKIALGLTAGIAATHISAWVLKTDGLDMMGEPVALTRPCPPEIREALLSFRYPDDTADSEHFSDLQRRVTEAHFTVAVELIEQVKRTLPPIEIVGYSGYTLHHGPLDKTDVYLGDGAALATRLGIPVIDRFAQADMKAGGVGAPLLSSFWEAATRSCPKPLAIVNLGGITRLTYIGPLGEQSTFDVGVGCLLLDRWLQRHAGLEMDFNGVWSAKGQADSRLLTYLLRTEYLLQPPPKSIDRAAFDGLLTHLEGCRPADGAATLTEFIVQSLLQATSFLSDKPMQWLLTGGGAANPALVLRLKKALGGSVLTLGEAGLPPAYGSSADMPFWRFVR